MTNPIRISLSEQDFYNMCCGRTIRHGDVEISLQDIGLSKMAEVITRIHEGTALPSCDDGCIMRKPHCGACMA